MSQLKKGAILNYTTIFLTNVIGLLLTPLILSHLGKNEYGIYITIGAIIGTISVLDFGLNNTIVRFVAKYKAQKDEKGLENFIATAFLIYAFISLLVIIFGFIFYNYIDSYFTKLTPDEIHIAKIIFAIAIFNLAVGLPGAALTGICYGFERFVFPKAINIVRYILRSLTIVAVLLYGGKAIALTIVESFYNITIILITGYYVLKRVKVKIKLHSFSIPFIKQIFSYSIWIFVFALVSLFQWKAGHWVLGRMCTPEVLSIYGIGVVLGTYYGAFSTAISSVFLPRATQMTVNDASGEELTSMMIKIGRLSFMILMLILGAFLFLGRQFVYLWVGDELGEQGSFESWLIAVMIMLAYTLPLIQGFGNSILEAKSKLAFKAILYLSFMIIGTIIGALLVKSYGAVGMMMGSIFAWFIVQNIMNVYYHKVIKLNIYRFFKELSKNTLLAVIIAFTIAYLVSFIPGNNWLNFIFKASLFSLSYMLLIYLLGMNKSEKEIFTRPLKSLVKKIK